MQDTRPDPTLQRAQLANRTSQGPVYTSCGDGGHASYAIPQWDCETWLYNSRLGGPEYELCLSIPRARARALWEGYNILSTGWLVMSTRLSCATNPFISLFLLHLPLSFHSSRANPSPPSPSVVTLLIIQTLLGRVFLIDALSTRILFLWMFESLFFMLV